MSYKTILVQVDDSKHLDPRIEIAAEIAAAENAHLIGVAITGAARFLYETVAVAPDYPDITTYLDVLRQRAEAALTKFENTALRLGVASFEKRVVDDEAAGGVSLTARYCDLTILGQVDPGDPDAVVTPDFPEYVAMNSGGPVLIIPYINAADTVAEKVLIAWNASMEAARAVHSAVPLLQRAKKVEAAIINPDSLREDAIGVPPGAELKAYLARQNISASIITHSTDVDPGAALLALAKTGGNDAIVMGCYGHSRFREILLGGATRSVLKSATIPVLTAH